MYVLMRLHYAFRIVIDGGILREIHLVRIYPNPKIEIGYAAGEFRVSYIEIPAVRYAGKEIGFTKAFDIGFLEKLLALDGVYGTRRDYFVAKAMERFFRAGFEGFTCPVTSLDWAFDEVRECLGEAAVEAFALMLLSLCKFGFEVGGEYREKKPKSFWCRLGLGLSR